MLFLWRLLLAPFNGLLITFATIPLIAIAGAGIWAFIVIGGTPGIAVIAISVIFLLVLMNAIMTQMTRFAGSFSGALRLSEQIPFFKAFWRVLIIIIVLSIITSVIFFALIFSLFSRGPEAISSLEAIGLGTDGGERDFIVYLETKWFLSYTLITMFMCAFQAAFLVPMACGMGQRFAKAWTGTYFLLRLALVLPVLSIVVYALGSVLGVLLVDLMPPDSTYKPSADEIRWVVVSMVSMQFALAGEAAVLRTAREPVRGPSEVAEVPEQTGPSAGDLLRDRMSR